MNVSPEWIDAPVLETRRHRIQMPMDQQDRQIRVFSRNIRNEIRASGGTVHQRGADAHFCKPVRDPLRGFSFASLTVACVLRVELNQPRGEFHCLLLCLNVCRVLGHINPPCPLVSRLATVPAHPQQRHPPRAPHAHRNEVSSAIACGRRRIRRTHDLAHQD